MGLGPIWKEQRFSEYKWVQLYICQVIIRWVFITRVSGDQLYLVARSCKVYRISESFMFFFRVFRVFWTGRVKTDCSRVLEAIAKARKFEATAVRGEYSKNGAKVCKGRSSKIDRFLRCQLLSTFNFSHFQSWGCHTTANGERSKSNEMRNHQFGSFQCFSRLWGSIEVRYLQ